MFKLYYSNTFGDVKGVKITVTGVIIFTFERLLLAETVRFMTQLFHRQKKGPSAIRR